MFIKIDNLINYNIAQTLFNIAPKYFFIIFIGILLTLYLILLHSIKSYGGYIRKVGENSFLILYTKSDLSTKKMYINNNLYNFKILKNEEDKIILKIDLKKDINYDKQVVLVNIK